MYISSTLELLITTVNVNLNKFISTTQGRYHSKLTMITGSIITLIFMRPK